MGMALLSVCPRRKHAQRSWSGFYVGIGPRREGAYSSTDGLWDALQHRIYGGGGFEVFIPDVRAQDGSTSSVSAYAYLLQQRRLLALAPTAPCPPLPPEVANCPPIPWSARVSPKSAPAAHWQAVTKAQALIKESMSTCREPAFLIAANALGLGPSTDSMMGGAGADEGMGEEVLYDIPSTLSVRGRRSVSWPLT